MSLRIVFEYYIGPALLAFGFIWFCSMFKEPKRLQLNALLLSGLGSAYLNGGFGNWELLFCFWLTYLSYKGLESYRYIGIGLLFHAFWDLLHHNYGTPIIPTLQSSSFGCLIYDPIVALWCFKGGLAIKEIKQKLLPQ